jgi:hypothetical protein
MPRVAPSSRTRHIIVRTGWVGRWLGVTHVTVRAMTDRHELPPPLPFGRDYRWRLDDLLAFAREKGIEIPEELLPTSGRRGERRAQQ